MSKEWQAQAAQGLCREECHVVEGAKHAACTMEMASIACQVDVAVVVEIYGVKRLKF